MVVFYHMRINLKEKVNVGKKYLESNAPVHSMVITYILSFKFSIPSKKQHKNLSCFSHLIWNDNRFPCFKRFGNINNSLI